MLRAAAGDAGGCSPWARRRLRRQARRAQGIEHDEERTQGHAQAREPGAAASRPAPKGCRPRCRSPPRPGLCRTTRTRTAGQQHGIGHIRPGGCAATVHRPDPGRAPSPARRRTNASARASTGAVVAAVTDHRDTPRGRRPGLRPGHRACPAASRRPGRRRCRATQRPPAPPRRCVTREHRDAEPCLAASGRAAGRVRASGAQGFAEDEARPGLADRAEPGAGFIASPLAGRSRRKAARAVPVPTQSARPRLVTAAVARFAFSMPRPGTSVTRLQSPATDSAAIGGHQRTRERVGRRGGARPLASAWMASGRQAERCERGACTRRRPVRFIRSSVRVPVLSNTTVVDAGQGLERRQPLQQHAAPGQRVRPRPATPRGRRQRQGTGAGDDQHRHGHQTASARVDLRPHRRRAPPPAAARPRGRRRPSGRPGPWPSGRALPACRTSAAMAACRVSAPSRCNRHLQHVRPR